MSLFQDLNSHLLNMWATAKDEKETVEMFF